MTFVTDFLWRSPLGLRINAQDTAGVTQTEDWVRIRGDQLAPRDGRYDVRITAELWETHFFDHVSLMVVDHPDRQPRVFVDERFSAASPPRLAVQALRAAAARWRGRSTTRAATSRALVAARDGRYLATFARGTYQGIAAPHAVEIDLPGGGRRRRAPLRARRRGLGVSHRQQHQPRRRAGRRREAERARARRAGRRRARGARWWPTSGFPAGKNKSMLIDLAPARGRAALRLRTNLEIYWDRLSVAERAETRRCAPSGWRASRAELRFRGFSQTSSPRGEAPETPDYAPARQHRAALARPRWAITRASATCASC